MSPLDLLSPTVPRLLLGWSFVTLLAWPLVRGGLHLARDLPPRLRYLMLLGLLVCCLLPPFLGTSPTPGGSGPAWGSGADGPVASGRVAGAAPALQSRLHRACSGPLGRTAGVLWAIGVIVGASSWWRRVAALHRRRRTWAAVPDSALLRASDRPAAPILTGSGGQPMATGFLRPVVYLPDWTLEELDRGELAMIVRHELAHLRWGDSRVETLLGLVEIVLWPCRPLIWMIDRARLERERAADREACRVEGATGVGYSTLLLRVGERGSSPRWAVGASGQLESRVKALLGLSRARPAVGVAGLALLGAAGILLAQWAPPGVPPGPRAHWGPLDHELGFNPAVRVVESDLGESEVWIEGRLLSPELAARFQASRSLEEKAEIVRSVLAPIAQPP